MDKNRLDFIAAALDDEGVRARYWAKTARRATGHWWYTGAVMRSGHGRFWVGRDQQRDVVVLAHRFGYALAYGLSALLEAPVLRHDCDEALCQRPDHLIPALNDHDNRLDWLLRRHRIGSPLRDVRGRAGRARAIRAAVLAGEDVHAVMTAGMPDLDRDQPTLF